MRSDMKLPGPWIPGPGMTLIPANSWRRRAARAVRGLILFAAVGLEAAASGAPLWFDAPAQGFTSACPLGNGRLGAMDFGGADVEHMILNESGMWSGSRQDSDRSDAAAALPEIRRLLLAGRNAEAEKLVNAHFTCAGAGSGKGVGGHVPYGCYQELGDLWLRFAGAAGPVTDYRRELDLNEAVARVSYVRDGVRFTREAFVSAPDECLVLQLDADKPGSLSFDVELSRPERAEARLRGTGEVLLAGRLDNGAGGEGVRFAAIAGVRLKGGSMRGAGNRLEIRNADSATIRLTAATDLNSFAGRRVTDPERTAAADAAAAANRTFAELRARHVADYRVWNERMALRLGPDGSSGKASLLPMPARLAAFQQGADDPGLAAVYFDFGRYLLISSSRPGGLPANLQGLWAEGVQTPWNGDWHLNVNIQMNYWPAEVCNLSALQEPLFDLTASLQAPGARTARAYYGAGGWVAHVITNPWGFTSPGESASWGATSTCSAWLCQHLWDHYLFTRDRVFLARAYPVLKGAAEFYLDMLIAEPAHGWLVTAPSNSPENAFLLPDGGTAHVCLGSTADMQILRYLFAACGQAAA